MGSSPSVRVPFADLHAQYESIHAEVDAAIEDVIRQSAFIRGAFVERFEHEFAAATGARHCVSCANGTDALYIAMKALGVGQGDEVIAPAHSWIATTETITQTGARVVFCDTDPVTFTLDPGQLSAKLTSKTVGVIPVHLYGQAAEMDPIVAFADRHKLWVVEDCAQAHLARYKGRPVGTFGVAGTFSFYPSKNLGAMGDAGGIVTRDPDLARRMAMFARHGGLTKGDHQIEGINSRLDGLQAAILSAKLKHLSQWNSRRREIAALYSDLLGSIHGLELPRVALDREHVWHLYVVQHADRSGLAEHLGAHGIQTVINYPTALPFLPAYAYLGHRPEDFPVAYHHQSRILSLPMFPEMTNGQIAAVCDAAASFACTR